MNLFKLFTLSLILLAGCGTKPYVKETITMSTQRLSIILSPYNNDKIVCGDSDKGHYVCVQWDKDDYLSEDLERFINRDYRGMWGRFDSLDRELEEIKTMMRRPNQ